MKIKLKYSVTYKYSLKYIISFLLVVFSNIYLAGVSSFSPYYFFLVFSVFLFGIYLNYNSKIIVSNSFVITLFFLLYTLLSSGFISSILNSRIWIISQITFLLCIMILVQLTELQLYRLSRKFIRLSILILIVECIYRFLHPNLSMQSKLIESNGEGSMHLFYVFKTNSLMFLDSNFVGLLIICVFFYCYYLFYYKKLNYFFEMLCLFILNILTLSRASILTMILVLLGIKLYQLSNNKPIVRLFLYFFIFMCVFSIPFILFLIGNLDVSFLERLTVITDSFEVFSDNIFLFLLGDGCNSAVKYVGRGAHVFIFTMIYGGGAISLLLFLFQCICFYFDTNKRAILIILPFFICGLSLGDLMSFFYVPIALIYSIERVDKYKRLHI